MLELFLGKVEYIYPLIATLGIFSYGIILLMAALESAPVIGTFTPGTLILLFFGLLASQGQLSLIPIVLFATLGGVLGDTAGYFLGKYGRGFIKENKGILRTGHLEQGRAFFSKHGGKSVFLGRFVGPIRPIIPLVAGMVEMSFKKFFFLNISSAFLWAILYVSLGFYFGNQIELIDSLVSRFGIISTLLVVGGVGYAFHRHRKKALNL